MLCCGIILCLCVARAFGQASTGTCVAKAEDGSCLWLQVDSGSPKVSFAEATDICAAKASTVAQIRSKAVYKKIMKALRRKISPEAGDTVIYVWIGGEFNPAIGEITAPSVNAFTKWHQDAPGVGSMYAGWTNLYLRVEKDPKSKNQGMGNLDPNWNTVGVVCQSIQL